MQIRFIVQGLSVLEDEADVSVARASLVGRTRFSISPSMKRLPWFANTEQAARVRLARAAAGVGADQRGHHGRCRAIPRRRSKREDSRRCQDREARALHHPRVEGAAPRTTLLSRGIFTFAMRRGSRARLPASSTTSSAGVTASSRPTRQSSHGRKKENPTRAWERAFEPARLRYS